MISGIYKKKSIFLKPICIIIIHSFLLSGISFAIPSNDAKTLSSQEEIIANPEKIVIPRDLGMVKSKYAGKGGKLIVHIQDAHCNYEAQSNIAKILEALVKNDALSFVAVEGADGLIDTSWFKSFPDDAVRKEVADYFMKKGEITGPEFLSITTDYPIKLFGAETREYYIQNLNAFTSSYPLKDETEKYFNQIKTMLNRLKGYVYSEELKIMDSKIADYDSKKLQFNDYVRFLQAEAEKHKINLRQYDNFFKLVNVLIYEKKIDFNVTDKERSSLIDDLNKRMAKDALVELVNQSMAFKVGRISSADYYTYLKDLASKNGIDLMKDYQNLYNYIIYNSVYSKIDNEKLFSDIKKLETDIKEKLFQDDDQRTLEKLSRHIDILIGLVNIKLLNDDFEYYKDHKDEFTHDAFAEFVKDKIIQHGLVYELEEPADAVAETVSKLEDFYLIAVKRDKALVDNTLNAMDKAGQKIAVLVTGGFHSEGIARLLEKQDVSYLVVCPSITKDVPTPYIQILTNQRTPFEEILVGGQETRHGMLAPVPRTYVVSLSENARAIPLNEKARQEFVRIYGEDLGETFKDEWIRAYVPLWLAAQIKEAGPEASKLDREFLEGYFRTALKAAAVSPDKDSAAQMKMVNDVMSSAAFRETFDAAFARLVSSTSGGMYQVISPGQAYSSPEMFRAYIAQELAGVLKAVPELEGMMHEYRKMPGETKQDKEAKEKFAKKIDTLIRQRYNAKLVETIIGASLESIADKDVVKDIPTLDEFKKSPDYPKYLKLARKLKFSDAICWIDVWGGAASRLFGEGQNVDPSLSYAAHDVYGVAVSRNLRSEADLKAQGARQGISMATRMMVQDRIFKEKDLEAHYKELGVAKTHDEIAAEARRQISNDPRIVIINDESGKSIVDEIVRNQHYGRNWELMVFVAQRAFKGWDAQNGVPVEAETSRPLPAGHGDATERPVQANEAFLVDPSGKIVPLKEDARDYLMKKTGGRIQLFMETRVNDMIKLGGSATGTQAEDINDIDMGILALMLSQMGRLDDLSVGKNAIFEQVAQNPKAPVKGASPVRAAGKESLVEGVGQSDHVASVVINDKNPFNRFYVAYKPGVLDIMKRKGLPVYFRFRDGYLYPETVTGDITMLEGVNAGYVVDKTRILMDYKDDKTIHNGLAAALGQDASPLFVQYSDEVQARRSNVELKDIENAPGLGEKASKTAAGSIRMKPAALTTAEHGTRGVRATVLPDENTVNGAIASRIAVPGSAYALFYVKQPDLSNPDEIQIGAVMSETELLSDLQLVNLSALVREGPKIGMGLVVIKGLKDELGSRAVATDLVFHPGYSRLVTYVDEGDLFYLLSLDNGVELLLNALAHEKVHVDKPDLPEAQVEKQAPTYKLRIALLMKDGMTPLEANLKLAIDGDDKAYNMVVAMPKEKPVEYFESDLTATMKSLPEDIFGFGNGYDVRGNAQPIKGGVVDLTPANLYLIGKLMGTYHAKPGDKVLLTGDIRLHTPILRYCMALGIASTGVNVEYAPDFLTTGAHNLLATENRGGYRFMVQVSGSHGASPKNGFKIKVDLGNNILEPLYAEKLEDLYKARNNVRTGAQVATIKQIGGLEAAVVSVLDETLPPIMKDELVVIDPRAGAAGPTIAALLKKRGFAIIDMDKTGQKDLVPEIKRLWDGGQHRIAVMLNMAPDGNMSRGIWDPSLPEALEPTQKLVNLINAKLTPDMPKATGAVFDGDADRISAILEDGRAVPAFEMTLPYYQRFLIDKDNQEVMEKIAKAGGQPIKVVCDVRANSKLLSLIDNINRELQQRTGVKDRNIVEGYFITTGYPPQLGFMQNRISELEKFVKSTPALNKDAGFMKKFDHLKKTYFTAEASGHNFFHISKAYPSRVCDCAISGFVTLLNIRETIGQFEAPAIGLEQGRARYDLTELFDKFPPAYSSREVTVSIPNNIKISTVQKIGAWMKDRFAKELKGFSEPKKEGDYLMQPKDDGFVTVAGFKVQLKDGRSALVRWSNTSEKLTTIFEGRSLPDLINITKEITDRLRQESAIDVAPLDKEIARLETLKGMAEAPAAKLEKERSEAAAIVYDEETGEAVKDAAPRLPQQFSSDKFEWIPGREGVLIRMIDNHEAVYRQITEAGEWGLIGAEKDTVSEEVAKKPKPPEDDSRYFGVGAATREQAEMLRTERENYIYKKYVAEDEAALRSTIMPIWLDKSIADNITVVLLYDTGLEPDAQKTVQAGDVAISKYLGDSVIEFRGRGAKLLDAALTQIEDLKSSGKKFAVVTIAGDQTLSEMEKKLMPLIKDINARMAEHQEVKLRQTRRPISAVMKIEDSRMSPIALYDIALKIGYNFGEDDIYMALTRVALNGFTNDVFRRTDLEELLKTGYISLKPIRPIDINEAREAYEAQAAALRSM